MIKKNVDLASANMEQILNWLQIDGTGKASTWWAEPLIVIGQELYMEEPTDTLQWREGVLFTSDEVQVIPALVQL